MAIRLFLISWLLCQAASLAMMKAGSRLAGHRFLRRLGEMAYRRKLDSLNRIWPLTRLRPAVARGDFRTCAVILSSAILVKSAASLLFGPLMVFWLPLAAALVPSMVAVHDPADRSLGRWVERVATLQLTSHAVAAGIGFALAVVGPLAHAPLSAAIGSNWILVTVGLSASVGFAIAAGRAEAAGVIQRGI